MRNPTILVLSLNSALLAIAAMIAPASIADEPSASKTLYLHLYSNRYDITSMKQLPPAPREWQCIATVSVVSGNPFYFDIPCHYEPEMRMAGNVKRVGSRIDTDFIIDVADVGPAYRHVQKTPIELNTLHEFGDREFRFSISDSREPPVIKSKEPTPVSKKREYDLFRVRKSPLANQVGGQWISSSSRVLDRQEADRGWRQYLLRRFHDDREDPCVVRFSGEIHEPQHTDQTELIRMLSR